jgi:hypothetical protein
MFYDCKVLTLVGLLTAVYAMVLSVTLCFYTQHLAHFYVAAAVIVVTLHTVTACCDLTQRMLVCRHQHFKREMLLPSSRYKGLISCGWRQQIPPKSWYFENDMFQPYHAVSRKCHELHYSYSNCSKQQFVHVSAVVTSERAWLTLCPPHILNPSSRSGLYNLFLSVKGGGLPFSSGKCTGRRGNSVNFWINRRRTPSSDAWI